MQIRMAGASDIGRVRKNNQDSFYYDAAHGLAIVADGIGGRKGGEIASKMAVEGMRDAYLQTEMLRHEEITPFIGTAVDKVNLSIVEAGEKDLDIKGMGTTMNFLLFVSDRVYVAHVGDSRTYLYYQDHLWQLTLDHNIETFVARGWMNRDQIVPGTRDAALVRSMGLTTRCEVDIYDLKLRTGEIFITCSDGLSGMVDDKKILQIVRENSDNITRLPKILIDEANRNGGKDNVTVVVSQVKAV
jgi:protein phosphatase